MLNSEPINYRIKLAKSLYPKHQKSPNTTGESFKDINALHEHDWKTDRFKKRIKI